MNPHQLAAWIKTEHEIVADLIATLSEKAASVPRANRQLWIDETHTAFEHLRAHLTKHMALEEQDGYMSIVLEARPTLAREVSRLRREHGEFTGLMNRIQQALQEIGTEDNLLIRDVRNRIQDLLSYVDHHKQMEDILITSALNQDIGEKD
ncbi:MAG TPA: hemerythrin domain-containing protein [Phycisphaerae bacterium]|nr:hemerythrin domain-containing protein [Phycisphaerae bacterium]